MKEKRNSRICLFALLVLVFTLGFGFSVEDVYKRQFFGQCDGFSQVSFSPTKGKETGTVCFGYRWSEEFLSFDCRIS